MFPYGTLRRGVFGRSDDPEQARAARRRVWLLAIPAALAWAVVGWSGALGILDQFRVMSLNRIETWEPGSTVSLTIVFAAAVTVASMLGFALMWRGFGSGVHAGTFATAVGMTIGTALAMTSWTEPEVVGHRLPAGPWNTVDWVIYYEPYLVPAVCAIAAVVSGASTLHAAVTAAKEEDAEGVIRRLGVRVRGTIDHVEFTHIWVLGEPRFQVRVTYPGTTGPRTVVTTMTTSPFAAPMAGGPVGVRYHPADDTTVLVEPW